MSSERPSDGPAARLVDSVTPPSISRPNSEMHAIGLLLAGLLSVLLFPLLPFLVVLWVVSRLVASQRRPAPDRTVDRPRGPARPS